MSKSKIVAMMALIAFVMGIALVGDVVAGEKFKGRSDLNMLKWEQIKVGDEEGHVVAFYEKKGISTNLEGKQLFDGCLVRETGLLDLNLKTGVGSAQGYGDGTDKEGNKCYYTWEGKCVKAGKPWEGVWTIVKGTGKLEGITGKGTWVNYNLGGGWGYDDSEFEAELPR
jgi:hypothetical protein